MANFTHGMIIAIEAPFSVITFQWNPEKPIGPTAAANWDSVVTAASEIPFLHFGGGAESQIRFDLLYGREGMDGMIDAQIDMLRALTKPTAGSRGMRRPPIVQFIMGFRERCVVREVAPERGPMMHPMSLAAYQAKVAVTLLRWRD